MILKIYCAVMDAPNCYAYRMSNLECATHVKRFLRRSQYLSFCPLKKDRRSGAVMGRGYSVVDQLSAKYNDGGPGARPVRFDRIILVTTELGT